MYFQYENDKSDLEAQYAASQDLVEKTMKLLKPIQVRDFNFFLSFNKFLICLYLPNPSAMGRL